MSIPKLQHYVPQFLLKNFCSAGEKKIFVFDKKREETFSTNIKNVAVEQGFYNIELDDIVLSIEPNLSNLESKAAEVLAKVINDQSLEKLTKDDRYQLSIFAALQFSRVKQSRIRYKQIDGAIKTKLQERGIGPNAVSGYTPYTDADIKRASILGLAKDVGKFAPYFLNKSWILFKATKTVKNYISDNPITLQNRNDHTPYGNLGLAVKGIEIYFPLSSDLSLGIFCQTNADVIRSSWSEYVTLKKAGKIKNLDLANNEVGSLKRLKYGLETGRAIQSLDDNVINRNSLQVIQSTRFIYSIDGNFDLAYQILSENPQFKEPPKIDTV